MEEFAEKAKELLSQRVQQVREEHDILSRAEKKEQMKQMDRILLSLDNEDREWLDTRLSEDLFLAMDACEALYLAGLKDGLRLLKLLII